MVEGRAVSEVVTITGALGSGKSVVGKAIAGVLDAPYFSTGHMQRELAARRGMTTLELNRLAETEPSIDHEIDGLMQEFAGKNRRCVLDSRLAWHFVPQSFKCYLQVHEKIGIERILGDTVRQSEKYESVEEAYQAILGRKASEEKRFSALYGLDLSDMSHYNFVADTSLASPDAIGQKAVECFRKWLSGAPFEKYWASPKLMYPMGADGSDGDGIEAVARDGFYFVRRGCELVSAALKQGTELVAYAPVEGDVQLRRDAIVQWEQRHSFKYFAYPDF